ncbi:hypothetical protein BJ165DRAFT_1524375 [Panaeolus papilionaceus]|nr:hypothetical protein BJ165DRAFT_1524375 [Panaeolus papilionaceus]
MPHLEELVLLIRLPNAFGTKVHLHGSINGTASVSQFTTALNLAWFCDPLRSSPCDIVNPRLPSLHELEITKVEIDGRRHTSILEVSARWEHTKFHAGDPASMGALITPFSLNDLHLIKLAALIPTPSFTILRDAPSLSSITLTKDSVFDYFDVIFESSNLRNLTPEMNPTTVLQLHSLDPGGLRLDAAIPFMSSAHDIRKR